MWGAGPSLARREESTLSVESAAPGGPDALRLEEEGVEV